jgi:glycine/D-amino acid oxidase-like deaminating enzyme
LPIIPHLQPDQVLPKHAAVVVIGGGIIGVSTALELAARGIDVVLVEKGEIAGEQSSRNWGWCRQMGRDPREIPLIKVSLQKWREMNLRVGEETGFRQCGIVYLSKTADELAGKEKWFNDNAKAYGLSTRMVTGAEADQLAPGSASRWAGAMFTEDDGRAEPFIAALAIAKAVQRKGGKVYTGIAARGLETSAGRISHVVTERGTIACDSVVVAGGYWSRRFLHNFGIPFPQLGVVNSVLRTTAVDLGHQRTFSGAHFAARKRLDGGYTIAHNVYSVADIVPDSFRQLFDFFPALILARKELRLRFGQRFIDEAQLARRWALDQKSPFEKIRILDPKPIQSILDDCFASLKKHYPAFKNAQIAEAWGGMIDATPDAVPVISAIARQPGLFLASGFSGHGFGLGPGAGQLMAEIVTGSTPCVDPAPFRYEKYFDGTKPRPTTGL